MFSRFSAVERGIKFPPFSSANPVTGRLNDNHAGVAVNFVLHCFPDRKKYFFPESRFLRPAYINNCMKIFTVNVATYLLDQDLNRMDHTRADLGLTQGQFVRQALNEFFAAPLPDRMTPVRGPVHKKDNPKFTVALIDDRQNDLLASSAKSLTWSRSKVIRLAILRKLERLAPSKDARTILTGEEK